MRAKERIVTGAEKLALAEIERYGMPTRMNFETSNEKGIELAERLSRRYTHCSNRHEAEGTGLHSSTR